MELGPSFSIGCRCVACVTRATRVTRLAGGARSSGRSARWLVPPPPVRITGTGESAVAARHAVASPTDSAGEATNCALAWSTARL